MDTVGPQLVLFCFVFYILSFCSYLHLLHFFSASLLSFSLYNFLFFSPLSLCPFMFVYVSKLYHSPYFLLLFPFILFIPLHLWSLFKSFGLSSLLTFCLVPYLVLPPPNIYRPQFLIGLEVCCSVTQSCLNICSSMDCTMLGFPVLHCLPELAQIHIHWVSDAIQQSHPLLSPSPLAFNLSQHQGLFQGVNFSHQVTKGLELWFQHQSFQWLFRVDFL